MLTLIEADTLPLPVNVLVFIEKRPSTGLQIVCNSSALWFVSEPGVVKYRIRGRFFSKLPTV
jgi:hypothetical protein